LDADIGIIEG
jgi:hypothetical protein